MATPSLSDTMKRTCDNLRQGATKQVTDYEQRFSILKDAYDGLLVGLIKLGFSQKEAWETAKEFFGSENVRFAGIDGTMYSRPLFDMVIFFGGAYAATGTLRFAESVEPQVEYDAKTIQQNIGISSVVPIYINEITDVDHSFAAQEQPGEVNPSKPATDEEIANNSLIANAIMTFSEYYLAYKLAVDPEQDIRVLLMDRSLSTERASLLYETRKTSFWDEKSALIGYISNGWQVDRNDLAVARQHVCSKALGLPAPRADYLPYAIICLAQENQTLTQTQICQAFEITDAKRKRRVEKALSRLVTKCILTVTEGIYALNKQYVDSWERIKRLTIEVGDKIFSINPKAETSSSMKIIKDGKEHWLTTLDIAFLTLFTLQMLMEECWRKSILLVGITKDTSARDFKCQLVPIMQNEGLLKVEAENEALAALPNTDRMILQSASIFNPEKVAPPWSLIEYDSAFRTMKADLDRGRGYVSGIIKNKIGLEKAFLKTYVQLNQAKSDPLLRSNVLLIDRLAYAEFDLQPMCLLALWNEMSDGTKEPVEVLLYKDKSVPNKMQNLVMTMLVAMSPTNIPEAFGHNKPLFVADKIAKWNYNQFKCVADSTANWILNNHKLRKFIFYMSTFRERRASIEQARRENR
ncbi:MAG: hypothetical protein ABSA75_04680 [Candidatus Bathyarchaeia archaeon]